MTPQTPEQIAGRLTKAQREALMHPNAGGSAYGWASMRTLEALNDRGLVGRKTGPGSSYSPRTAIFWPVTPLGLQVRAIPRGEL